MTTVQIEAGTLTANHADRILSGLLLPYGEIGNTNLGRFTVQAGRYTIPGDVTVLTANTDHARENPVARFLTAVETAAGLVASFKVAADERGDELLAEITDTNNPDARRCLSVEIADVVIRAGQMVSGRLFGAAFVKKGAFPSAALMAADVGEIDGETVTSTIDPIDGVVTIDTSSTPESVVVNTLNDDAEIESTTTFTPTQEQEPLMGNALPNTLAANKKTETPTGLSLREVGELLYAARHGQMSHTTLAEQLAGQNGDSLFAALSDVKYNGPGGLAPVMSLIPQWLGEVKALAQYKQLVLPLFNHTDLTSLSLQGFKWTQKPSGGDWAGNKNDVPSNTLTVGPVAGTATPWALGHDIAREFVDFPVPGFFESYAVAVLESYMRWADAKVAAAVVAGSTALAADAIATIPGSPAATPANIGGTIGVAASAIIDGAAVMVTNGILPTFALIAPALWKQMVKIPKNNVLGYLNASLGLEEGSLDGFTMRPSAAIAAGKVLVGAKGAATVYELPNAPIRIDALDLAKGGVDKAAFGYAGVVINDATALQLVTAATA